MEGLIESIKSDFRSEISKNDPKLLKLSKLKGDLFNLTNQTSLFALSDKEKTAWEKQIKKLQADIVALEKEIEEIKANKIYENAFEWRFEFPEVLNDKGDFVGFDVVIGNPPYIRQEEFSEVKPYLKNRYKIYHSIADLLTYFVELSYTILKTDGTFQFIISNKFARASYGVLMRRFLSEKTKLTHYIDFSGKPIFDEATVDAAIVGFKKGHSEKGSQFVYKEILEDNNYALDFQNYISHYGAILSTDMLNEEKWSFNNPFWATIINKINNIGIPLSEWDININRGVLTGLNEAFIIDEAKNNELQKIDPKSSNILKPLLRGRDIQKYIPDNNEKWLIATFPSLKIDINNYDAIKNYLLTFGKSIHQTGEKGSRKKTNHKWFETQDNIAFWKEFAKPKLIWKRIGSILRFCYDESGAYCLDSTCIATGSKVKFLCAVLNSKLCNQELFRLSPKTGTGDLIISVQALNPLKIPIPSETQERDICQLLDKIIDIKKIDNKADTSLIEEKIDQLVYELYGLTEEEIAIVEGKI
jgi:type II restriction/modification system DNA methylase subunit YeeA